MKKIAFVVGTRPNFIKLYPLYHIIKTDYHMHVINTGQHYTHELSDVFLETIPNIINLDISSKTQNSQIAEIMSKLEHMLLGMDAVIVFGDVTSSLAGALTANKLKIKLIHIEAGNRSFDRKMPEEINRILIDNLSDYLFISEPNGWDNLNNENIIVPKYYVGNIMIDALYMNLEYAMRSDYYKTLGLNAKKYILLTLHRESNVDTSIVFDSICNVINRISEKYAIVYPVHPRNKLVTNDKLPKVTLIKPQNYVNTINLMLNCGLVITDSGGMQEETTALKIPCITLRSNTERPITCSSMYGTNILCNVNDLESKVNMAFNKNFDVKEILYWDGQTRFKIRNILKTII